MLHARAPACRGASCCSAPRGARVRADAAPQRAGAASAAPAAKPSRAAAPPALHAPPPPPQAQQRRAFRFVNYGERADGPGFDATTTICCDGLVQARPARARARARRTISASRLAPQMRFGGARQPWDAQTRAAHARAAPRSLALPLPLALLLLLRCHRARGFI
jgi:hypothetical protein